jgi:hypothetical protein
VLLGLQRVEAGQREPRLALVDALLAACPQKATDGDAQTLVV